MAYTLKVLFRGLCVWVPGTDLSKPQEWFGAFLVNAGQNTLDALDHDPRLNFHFPSVRFDLKDLKGVPSGVDGKGVWQLDLEDVVIRPASSPGGNLTVITAPPSSPIGTVPKTGEAHFFDWVPKLADLIGSGAVVDDCLEPFPQQRLVAARIHLTEGTLSVNDLSNFGGKPVILSFVPVQSVKVERVIATEVLLEMGGLSGDLTLRAKKFDPPQTSVRTLVLADPGAGGTITIEILNLCAEELADLQAPRFPGLDTDFKLNYLVSKDGYDPLMDHMPLPLPLAISFDPGGSGGGEFARCTHPQAAPLTDTNRAILLRVAQGV